MSPNTQQPTANTSGSKGEGTVLVWKPDHLGDFALALPTLWELVGRFGRENCRVLVDAGNQEWGSILAWLPELEAVPHPRYSRGIKKWFDVAQCLEQISQLRSRRYDYGINLVSARRDRWGAIMLKAAGCRELNAIHRREDFDQSESLHEVRRLARRTPAGWGLTGQADASSFMSVRWQKPEVPRILLAPLARTPAKSWPLSSWQQLLGRWPRDVTRVLVPPGSAPSQVLNWVPEQQQIKVNSIADTLEVLRQSSVLIAQDTAVAHYGWLVGVPVVQIFAGTADPQRWGCLASGSRLTHPVPCAPCGLELCPIPGHPCLNQISVEQVLSATCAEIGTDLSAP